MKKLVMGTEAAALAARLAKVQVVSAYPITPQTVIVENLADIIGRGELEAKYMTVESEHSAMASCIGASLVGARAFTATSSQGLAYMHEMLHYAAGARVPVVMVNATGPWPPRGTYIAITPIHCPSVIPVGCSIIAPMPRMSWTPFSLLMRVAEQALLPVMINMDAFYLTHTSELVDVPDQEEVDRFSPSLPAVEQAGCE